MLPANITDEVRYTVECQAIGTSTTLLNLGSSGSAAAAAAAPRCCGSSTLTAGSKLEPTGLFHRFAVGGMLSIINGVAVAKYPPAEVRDLYAGLEQPLRPAAEDADAESANQTFQLYFTAPGDRLDSGQATVITVYFATEFDRLQTVGQMLAQESLNASLDLEDSAALELLPEFGQPVRLDVRLLPASRGGRFSIGQEYFFRLNVVNSKQLVSQSNTARLYLRIPTDPNQLEIPGLSVWAIAGIVLAALLAPAALGKAAAGGILIFGKAWHVPFIWLEFQLCMC